MTSVRWEVRQPAKQLPLASLSSTADDSCNGVRELYLDEESRFSETHLFLLLAMSSSSSLSLSPSSSVCLRFFRSDDES